MSEKKKYVINCDVCDTRNMKEESLAGYEQIMINADLMLVNERSSGLLNSLPVVCNVDYVLSVEGEVPIVTVNGDLVIHDGLVFKQQTILYINGNLSIQPGTEGVLEPVLRCFVNGNVRYTENMVSCVGKMLVNGRISCIPEGCVELKPEFEIDRYFPLRAKENAVYFVEQCVRLTDIDVNIESLAAKQVRFQTKRLIVCEELIEKAIGMFDESVELQVIPQGLTYAGKHVKLEEQLIRKYGSRLYVDGNLTIEADSEACLAAVEALFVNGDIRIPKRMADLLTKVNAEYHSLVFIKGRRVANKVQMTVNQEMLDASPDGLEIANCAYLKIDADVDPQAIVGKLAIANCAQISCSSPQQQNVIGLVCCNVAHISAGEDEAAAGEGVFDKLRDLTETKVVNADTFVL